MIINSRTFGPAAGLEDSTLSAAPGTIAPPGLAEHRAGELLVQFTAGTGADARAAALAHVGGNVLEQINEHGGGLLRISLGNGLSVEQAISVLSHIPGVQFAEPNYVLHTEAISDDPLYTGGSLWGMEGDQTSPANAFGSQAGEAWSAGYTGSTHVAVGVIDTGIDYTHPDLYLNVWLNQGEISTALRAQLTDTDGDGLITFRDLNAAANSAFVTDLNGNGRIDAGDLLKDARWADSTDQDGNGYTDDLIGWDFVNNDNDPYDDNEHGTHVSGTIAGQGGNGTGVAGVNWSAEIIALKFLDASGTGDTANAVKAIDYYNWAAAHNGSTDFVATNNSWGGGGFSQSMFDAIVRAAQQDVLFVAAAGNGGFDQRGDNNDATANYPSNYNTTSAVGWDSVIGVAAITSTGARASYSNYGATTVELGAPGSGIVSTVPGGGYASLSGTSMATPHVTGAIALYAAATGFGAQQIRTDLLASTAATSSLSGITMTGGRLDVSALMQHVGNPTPPPPVVNNIYGTTASDTIVGTTGNDVISGIPATGTNLGRGTIDSLTGNGGDDTFVLGDSRGRFYDDGKARTGGTSDYALIKDFGAGDHIQLAGKLTDYVQAVVTLNGTTGTGLYYDSNHNGLFDSKDELIGLVAGTSHVDPASFIFV
jgi:subtilisin family serine protease